VVAKTSKLTGLFWVLLLVSTLSAPDLSADGSQAAICSIKVQKFVEEIDALLSANHNSVYVFDHPIREYLPVKGCNVDEVISISRRSRFFVEAFDWFPAYTIVFGNSNFEVTFGLRKDTGNIEYPAAQTRLPKR
jgi:hypothetical protein